LREGEKRVGGGERGIFVAGLGVEERLGFQEIGRRAVAPCGRGRARPGKKMTSGTHLSAREGEESRTILERGEVGLGLAFRTGPNGSPSALSHFLISFSFPFSIFCFLSILLQIWFKSFQTRSYNILIIQAMF
jgi:hypothetical protein